MSEKKANMATYSKEKYGSWVSLDDHLDYPGDNFPSMITSNFLVAFDPPEGYEDKYPWSPGEAVLFLGEIPGMRGHGSFVGDDGLVRFAYHTHSFRVIPESEL